MSGVTKDPAALQDKLVEDRRRFLASCGRFAMITPPTMTLLLALGRETSPSLDLERRAAR
jgi:hypothetical protein